MMNQIFRLTFITFIWKKYKRVIVSLVALIFSLWMVEQIHQDFVQYSQLNNDTSYLAASFVIKWIVFLLAAVLFVLINSLFKAKKATEKKVLKSQPKKAFFFKLSASEKVPFNDTLVDSSKNQIDPFDAIRNKTKLRSKADVVLERAKKSE